MKEYLKGSIFDKDVMASKVTTNRISVKERWLGYVLGPGMFYVFYCTVLGFRELFLMDVVQINAVYHNDYTYMILTVVTTIIGMGTGFLLNHITEKTVCKAGRFRPYVFIGEIVMCISGFFMFYSPFEFGTSAYLVWLYVFNIIYTCMGLPMWKLRDQVVSVCSRNVLERNNVTTLRNAITNMISGVIVSLLIVGMIYPMFLQKDLSGRSWYVVIGITAIIGLIFSFVEHFWTRERVTEDNQKIMSDEGSATIDVPLKQQFKNLLTNKYYIIATIVMMGALFYDYIQGGNSRVNMISYILGGNDENGLQMIYLIIAMQPMAFGAIIVPNLAKKFSARKIMLVSSVITLVGVGVVLINPYSFLIAVIGGMIFSCGIFAVTNMFMSFMQMACDDIEYKHGYRPEGTLAAGMIITLYTTLMTPINAIYETGLSHFGYNPAVAIQNSAVNNWIIGVYYGAYALFAIIVLIACLLFDLDKKIPEIHVELKKRAKKAAEDRGEVYVDPEEAERIEEEKAKKELEELRIQELKEKCEKKGLDFETENKKYLDKLAKKQAKRKGK